MMIQQLLAKNSNVFQIIGLSLTHLYKPGANISIRFVQNMLLPTEDRGKNVPFCQNVKVFLKILSYVQSNITKFKKELLSPQWSCPLTS